MVRCLDDACSLQNQCLRGLLRPWIDPHAHHSRTTNKRGIGFFFVYDVRHSLPTNTSFPVTTPTSRIHSENVTAIAEVLRMHWNFSSSDSHLVRDHTKMGIKCHSFSRSTTYQKWSKHVSGPLKWYSVWLPCSIPVPPARRPPNHLTC